MVGVVKQLARKIISEVEPKIIKRLVGINYVHFMDEDKDDIINRTLELAGDLDSKMKRKKLIESELTMYIAESGIVNIDVSGFTTFRLRGEYQDMLVNLIDTAVDDYLVTREYRAFMGMLRCFVEMQEPAHELIHIYVDDDKYRILDEDFVDITCKYVQDTFDFTEDGEVNYEAMLLATLVTIAPAKLIIHSSNKFKSGDTIRDIKEVFSGSIIVEDDDGKDNGKVRHS